MRILKYIAKVQEVDFMIREEKHGVDEIAKKLNVSHSSVYNYLLFMRSLGAPIEYSRIGKHYFYRYPVKFSFGFKAKDPE